jgi:mRNA interferase MazF
MVGHGTIILVDFDPRFGHEQGGRRPALVISNMTYNKNSSVKILLPISNTKSNFPPYLALDGRTKTTGKILCDHIRTMDIEARNYEFIEMLPLDILQKVLATISGLLEIEG